MNTTIATPRRTRIALAVALAGLILATGGGVASACQDGTHTLSANESAQNSTAAEITVEAGAGEKTDTEQTPENETGTEAVFPDNATDDDGERDVLRGTDTCAPNCTVDNPTTDIIENSSDPFEDPDKPVVEVNDSMAETPDTGLPMQNETETDGGDNQTYTQAEREKAAKMIEAYYDGYVTGISMATDSGWAHERGRITEGGADGENPTEPWPLEVWNSTEDARVEGQQLGSGAGADPITDAYQEKKENATDDE